MRSRAVELSAVVAWALLLGAAGACNDQICTRHSDCDPGLVCGVGGICSATSGDGGELDDDGGAEDAGQLDDAGDSPDADVPDADPRPSVQDPNLPIVEVPVADAGAPDADTRPSVQDPNLPAVEGYPPDAGVADAMPPRPDAAPPADAAPPDAADFRVPLCCFNGIIGGTN